jgi:hypothetical protein
MKHFELRFFDRLNVLVLRRAYLGPDDVSAFDEAVRLSKTHTIEVWEGPRKVAHVKKGNIASSFTDRLGS